jgi:hypothetical protein
LIRLPRTLLGCLSLAVLFAVTAPSSASASHNAYIDALSPNQARCQVKGLFGIPIPTGDGALAGGVYGYIVTAVMPAGQVAPACPPVVVPVNPAASPAQNAALLQWNATPGAVGYKVHRGPFNPSPPTPGFTAPPQALITPGVGTTLPPSVVCPPGGAGPRCFYQDKGYTAAAEFPTAQAAPAPQAGGHPDLTITQRIDYGGIDPNSSATNTTDDPFSANPATHTAALKTDHFEFPPGLIANPRATRDAQGNPVTCKLTGPGSLLGDPNKFGRNDVNEDACPRHTLVGTVNSLTRVPDPANGPTATRIQPTQGDIYTGETRGGEAGRLYIVLRPLCSHQSPIAPGSATCQAVLGGGSDETNRREVEKQFLTAVATITRGDDGSYGIDVDVRGADAGEDHDLSKVLNVLVPNPGNSNLLFRGGQIPIQVRQISQRLFGYADQGTASTADDVPFVTLPTSCGVKTMFTDKTTHDDATEKSGSATFTTTGCENVPFDASTRADVDNTQVENPVGFGNATILGANDDPIHQSHIRKITATFPRGLVLSSSSGAAIQAIGAQLGTVSGFSEELGDLTGTLTLQSVGTDSAGHFNGSMVVRATVTSTAPGSETVLVLDGPTTADPATGQLTAVFDNLPEVPFKELTLTFNGGPNAPLVNPPVCGTHTVTQAIESWSGDNVDATDTFTTTFNGGACPATRPFAPKMSATTSTTQAAAFTALTTNITREDGEQALAGFELELPKGMLAKLGTIPLCPEANAALGTCGASSLVGSVKIKAGTGSSPVELPGTISLAEAVGGSGDVASLVVAIPVKVGPFDVGTVVSRARLQILFDPEVGVRVVTVGKLPTIAGGIPVRVRSLQLLIDAPGFQRNPSSCAPKQFVARFTSQGDPTTAATAAEGGATSTATSAYGATGCEAVPFAPRVAGTVDASNGQDKKGGHPGLTVTVRQNDDEAGTRSARVTLPGTLTSNIVGLENPCTEAQLAANQCPALATVGEASAKSPLIPVPLSGPIVAITQANDLPKLAVLLRGPLNVRLDAFISLDTTSSPPLIKIINTFPSVPDVPLSEFTLKLKGGAQGLFTNAANLCSGVGSLEGVFEGHNDKKAAVSSVLAVAGAKACAADRPTASGRIQGVKRNRADLTVDVGRDDAKGNLRLKSVRLSLPKGVSIRKSAARRRLTATSNERRLSRRTLRLTSRQVTVSRLGSGKSRIELRFRPNSLALSRTVRRRGRNQTLSVRLRVVDRANRVYNITLRLRPRS